MAISVLAELLDDRGAEATYRLTGDPAEPGHEVVLRELDGHVVPDPDPQTDPRRFVAKGVAAVAVERARSGAWPARVVRVS